MSRVSAADVGLCGDVRVNKAGPHAGFEDLHVAVAATGRRCPRCGRAMIRHGSFSKEMSHVVGDTPCRLNVKVPREHPGEAWVAREREATCRMPGYCDTKHPRLRQTCLAMQPCCAWQDARRADRYACGKAPGNWMQKAAGPDVPEIRSFAHTVAAYRQHLVTGTVTHASSARAEAADDKTEELKRKGRGFGSFGETRRRLVLAFGGAGAAEGATARARRRETRRAALAVPEKRKEKRQGLTLAHDEAARAPPAPQVA